MSQSEELLVQLLDGTLSAADRQRLEALMSQDQSLAEEVRGLEQVENLLHDRAEATHAGSSQIRAEVLQSIRAEYTTAGAANINGAASSKTVWYGGGALLLVATAVLTWYGVSSSAEESGEAEQANAKLLAEADDQMPSLILDLENPPEPAQRQYTSRQDRNTESADSRQSSDVYWPGPARDRDRSLPAPNDKDNHKNDQNEANGKAAASRRPKSDASKQDASSAGKIDGNAGKTPRLEQQLRDAVKMLEQKMHEYHSQGNTALEASTAHRLAGVYVKLGDQAAAAAQYHRAGNLAATHGLRALEAQSRADLALMNVAADRDASIETVRESINTLRELGRDTKSYEQALEKLQD